MPVNSDTLNLIKSFEGFVPNWYRDPVGVWTCCYGHTDMAGEPFYAQTKTKRFTEIEGSEILNRDLRKYELAVNRNVKVPLNANQYGALVSFTYNLGEGNLKKSTFLKKVNAGDFAGAANEFGKWVNAGGKQLAGLVRRRKAERDLFLTPISGMAPQPAPTPTQPQEELIVRDPGDNIKFIIGAFIVLGVIAFAMFVL